METGTEMYRVGISGSYGGLNLGDHKVDLAIHVVDQPRWMPTGILQLLDHENLPESLKPLALIEQGSWIADVQLNVEVGQLIGSILPTSE